MENKDIHDILDDLMSILEIRYFNYRHKYLNKKIEDLPLSTRTYNCLKNYNIVYIGDLVQETEQELKRIPYFGRKSLNEISEVLQQMDLGVGMYMSKHELSLKDKDNYAQEIDNLEKIIDYLLEYKEELKIKNNEQ